MDSRRLSAKERRASERRAKATVPHASERGATFASERLYENGALAQLRVYKRRVRASHVSVAVVQGQSIHVGGRGNWGVFLHARPESDDWQLFIVKTGADDESDDAHFADVAFGAAYETACRAALFENSRPIRDAHATSYALDGDGARLLYSVLPLDGEVPADFDAALSIVRCACPDRWSDW